MAVSRAQKAKILETLEAHLKDATVVAFTTNNKLTVEDINAIRADVRTASGVFMLAKKTLIRIAFKNVLGVDLDIDSLPGQIAITIGKGDKVAPLAALNKHAIEHKKEQKVVFAGGYMDARIMGGAETARLASLPSREVLLAKLLGSMMSPLSGLARFFDGAKKELETKGQTKVGDLIVANATPAPAAVEAPAPAAVEAPAPAAVEAPAPVVETPVVEEAPAAEVAVEAPASEEAAA